MPSDEASSIVLFRSSDDMTRVIVSTVSLGCAAKRLVRALKLDK